MEVWETMGARPAVQEQRGRRVRARYGAGPPIFGIDGLIMCYGAGPPIFGIDGLIMCYRAGPPIFGIMCCSYYEVKCIDLLSLTRRTAERDPIFPSHVSFLWRSLGYLVCSCTVTVGSMQNIVK